MHFTEFMSYLDTLDIDLKIIALSETAINSCQSIIIYQWNVEIHFRKKKNGGGASLYIQNQLQYKLRNDLQLGGDVNSVFVEIFKSSTNAKFNVICGCVYRPPFLYLKTFNELLSRTFNKLKNQNNNIYITGDFNVNTVSSAKGSLATQDFKNILSSNFLHLLINKPTRITSHSATLIDTIYRTRISDHYAIFLYKQTEYESEHKQFDNKT